MTDTVAPFAIDGFVIYEAGEPISFVACTKDDRMRDKVEDGLAMRIDFERCGFEDTRWAINS